MDKVYEIIFKNLKDKQHALNLSNIGLNEIPSMVFDLEHLKVLKLMGNNIQELPEEISKLNRLSHLYLYQNKIKELPKDILKEMPFLECIDIGENPINYEVVQEIYKEQEKWIDYRRFVLKLNDLAPNSESIYFWGNIHQIPKQLFDFNELKYVLISGQNITEIPKDIIRLKKLIHLDLPNNKLTSIPNELMNLNSLESLNLDENEFTFFPSEILKIPNIKSISFNYNKITHIKEILNNVAFDKSINHFSFGANPLKDFESEMFRGGIDYIREVVYRIEKDSITMD